MLDTSDPHTPALATDSRSAILDALPVGIFEIDANGQCVFVNRQWQLYAGMSAEAAVGSGLMEAVHPADRERVVEEWLSALAVVREDLARLRPGQLPAQNENHWITRDGRLRLIAWSDVCFFDDEGRATHLISTGIDITEERRGDEAMRGIEAVGTLLAKAGLTAESMAAVLATLSDRMGYPYLSLFIQRGTRFELGAAVGYDERPVDLDPTIGIVGGVLRSARSAFLERDDADTHWQTVSP